MPAENSVRGDEDRSFPRPFNFERCHGIDAILNSTRVVFGETTPGQLAAMIQSTTRMYNLLEECPIEGFKAMGLDGEGYRCDMPSNVNVDMGLAEENCAKTKGKWKNGSCYYGEHLTCPDGWRSTISSNGVTCTGEGSRSKTATLCANAGMTTGKWVAEEDTRKLELIPQSRLLGNYRRPGVPKLPSGTRECYHPNVHELVVDPGVHGYCCLDDADVSGVWGEPYTCEETCTFYAPALAGLSSSACDIYGGTWCQGPTDCSELRSCVQEYLDDADDKASDGYNPSFADYLRGAPTVMDASDPFECGQVRGYFGFDPTLPIDGKICHDILEYRNARNFDFVNDVFEEIPEGNGKSGLPGLGSESSGSGVDDDDDVVKYVIDTAALVDFEAADAPSGTCDSQAMAAFKSSTFSLNTIFEAERDIYYTIKEWECPEDWTGFLKTACAGTKNKIVLLWYIAVIVLRTVSEIAENLMDNICGQQDPYTLSAAFEEIYAIHKNAETMYGLLAQRMHQSHQGLNSISNQLPKLDKKIGDIQDTLDTQRRLTTNDSVSSFAECAAIAVEMRAETKSELEGIKEDMKELKEMLRSIVVSTQNST